MGDVLTLVEKAQEEFNIADAEKMQKKILEAEFDFSDFLKQMRLLKNMGSLGGLIKMIPGMNKISATQLEEGETKLKQTEAMIGSMTIEERRDPELLSSSPSRRRRIAKGSGYTLNDVSKLVSDFQKMRAMMKQMGQGQFPGMGGMNPFAGGMGGMNPFGGGMGEMGGMNPLGGGMNPGPTPGWRGYSQGGKKKKKDKKRKGFGSL
jgi:signal recognition particle subunit SRP54